MDVLDFNDLLNTAQARFRGARQREVELFCQQLTDWWVATHAKEPVPGGGLENAEIAAIASKAVLSLPDLEAHELAILAAGSLGAAMNAQFQTNDLSKRLAALQAPAITNPAHVMTQLKDERKWLATVDPPGTGHRKFQLTPLGIAELRTLCFRSQEHERLNAPQG